MGGFARFECHVEDYYHAIAPWYMWPGYEDRVESSTRILLDMLRSQGIRGTFFVLGHVAEYHPDLIREIHKDGHLLGSHGYFHGHHERKWDSSDLKTRDVLFKIFGGYEFADKEIPYCSPYWDTTPRPGIAGGTFFRVMPYKAVLYFLQRSGVFYIHPFELDEDGPQCGPRRRRLGRIGVKDKLRRLLKDVSWRTP